MCRDRPVELGGAQVADRPDHVHAGVVDQDVQPPELGGDPVHRLLDRGRVAAVGAQRERPPPHAADLVRDGLGGRGVLPVGERHVGAAFGQAQRDRRSDPAGGPGDQGGSAVELGGVHALDPGRAGCRNLAGFGRRIRPSNAAAGSRLTAPCRARPCAAP
jgi:hypothetical protein